MPSLESGILTGIVEHEPPPTDPTGENDHFSENSYKYSVIQEVSLQLLQKLYKFTLHEIDIMHRVL